MKPLPLLSSDHYAWRTLTQANCDTLAKTRAVAVGRWMRGRVCAYNPNFTSDYCLDLGLDLEHGVPVAIFCPNREYVHTLTQRAYGWSDNEDEITRGVSHRTECCHFLDMGVPVCIKARAGTDGLTHKRNY